MGKTTDSLELMKMLDEGRYEEFVKAQEANKKEFFRLLRSLKNN